MKINYSELVSAYYENLNENLRHFRGGPGFLETWVHDEDHSRSLLAILDLAQSEGIEDLEIELPQDISIQFNWLKREASSLGQLEWRNSSLFFRLGKADEPGGVHASVHPAYREALKNRKIRFALDGGLPALPGESWLSASQDLDHLHLRVNQARIVTDARHESKNHGPLLDHFADQLIGRSLQEGIDHGVIRLENTLRDPKAASPAKGVVAPEIADPIFLVPLRLIRQFASPGERNEWRDPLPGAWVNLPEEEKLQKARSALQAALLRLELGDPGIEITAVKNHRRLVIAYPPTPANKYWHYHLIDLERALRALLGFEAELQLEDTADRNKRVERTKRVGG